CSPLVTTPLYTSLFFQCHCAPRDLHSFPTRRSSDLPSPAPAPRGRRSPTPSRRPARWRPSTRRPAPTPGPSAPPPPAVPRRRGRSEEHTSELQSRENLVCRLLLEKKNKTKTTRPTQT